MTEAEIIRLINSLEQAPDRAMLAELALLLGSAYQCGELGLADLHRLSTPGRAVFNQLCELIASLQPHGLRHETVNQLQAMLGRR
ncbi:hypothetical protein [Aquitalea sp. LB_tupeE]|uniref:hypothetical protein n=1 Tax=Aquitalea sp. LB_tupeE TaxID=2748078 RepID=UPI0015BBB941|nr:hypothetical protein [Aquitalea sp. LB_tupeE]NWK79881.1 hypothetical protein [Aquitalea sp. LB_tupeE]